MTGDHKVKLVVKGAKRMAHTPLPWWNESAVIHASNGKGGTSHPANCTPADFEDGDWAKADADAEFICRAVNNHADLLAALERVITARLIEEQGGPGEGHMTMTDALDWARAAIKQAKQG